MNYHLTISYSQKKFTSMHFHIDVSIRSYRVFPVISNATCRRSLYKYRQISNIIRTLVGNTIGDKQRVLTPGHQGWNDLHSLCRIGMEYYLLNNDDNSNNNDDDDDNYNNKDDDDDNRNNNNNDNDYNHNNDTNNDNNENDNDKNSSDSKPVTVYIGVFKTKLPGKIDITETMSC